MSGNQEQLEYWDGVGGQRWTTHQEALDRMVRPFGLAAIERLALRSGEHVLDVGCGCGDTLLALAERVGERGSVTGVDLSKQNGWGTVPFAAVRAAVPEAALGLMDRADGPGPFAFADRDHVASVLRAAGFCQVDIAPFDAEVELSTTGLEEAARFSITAGPAARLLAQASPEQKARAAACVADALAPHERNGCVTLSGAAWTVLARS